MTSFEDMQARANRVYPTTLRAGDTVMVGVYLHGVKIADVPVVLNEELHTGAANEDPNYLIADSARNQLVFDVNGDHVQDFFARCFRDIYQEDPK